MKVTKLKLKLPENVPTENIKENAYRI